MTKAKVKAKPVAKVKPPDLSSVELDDIIKELERRGDKPSTNGRNDPVYDHMHYSDAQKATILADVKVLGLTRGSEKYGIEKPALVRWFKRADTDPAFTILVTQKNRQYQEDWSAEAATTIRKLLDYLGRAADSGAVDDPAHVRALAGALKMVGEFKLAVDITYSKLGKGEHAPQLQAGEPNAQYHLKPIDGVIEGDVEELQEIP